MGFERHAIPATATPAPPTREPAAPQAAASVVTPLRPDTPARDAETLHLAHQMRGEWRRERYGRLTDR